MISVTGGGDMRERVGHERTRHESVAEGRERSAPRLRGWRAGPGPRPVRPEAASFPVRPPEAPRPVRGSGRPVVRPRWVERIGLRLLTRRPAAAGTRYGARRAVAGLVLVAASATAVVALGLLAGATAPAPVPASAVAPVSVPVVVTATPGETVWEVVDRVVPGASGPQRAALAERVVADNGLASVRLEPGQVLRVSPG